MIPVVIARKMWRTRAHCKVIIPRFYARSRYKATNAVLEGGRKYRNTVGAFITMIPPRWISSFPGEYINRPRSARRGLFVRERVLNADIEADETSLDGRSTDFHRRRISHDRGYECSHGNYGGTNKYERVAHNGRPPISYSRTSSARC